ncbi:replicative DNA helicase [Rhodocyclus tenuis]|uniref:Replicative DNA helicase n=2 Tax=Rhodocyclus TaxID=1064 RepID=A0A6L5JZP1_RHOTE|nr:replicative DNA helicase [Rhodocyclus gracilis]MQY52114.1 replicative DNA helicase [Rhodocyclus gracilis]NJA89458.1 replicative DNA helicase [Rhodocyclus gracilis]
MNAPAKQLRLPPHSIDAEQSVLGGLLLDNSAWDRIADLLSEGDFYRDEHRRIWRQISMLLENGKPVDAVTVAEALERAGQGEQTGGLAYLGDLAANTPSAANIRRYAEIVRERRVRRDVLAMGRQVAELAESAGSTTAELLEQVTGLVMGLADTKHAGKEPKTISELLPGVLDALDQRAEKGGQISGLPTGFRDLDKLTNGLHPGDLVIVAGRPSMGKTTMAVNIAENVAMAGGTAFVASLEMGADQLAERSMARFGSISTTALRSGQIDDEDYNRISASLAKLYEKRLVISDDPYLSHVSRVRLAARKVRQRFDSLDLIVIDYLQLMRGDGNTKNEELGGITRALKLLAREISCPIVLLSQLSRKVEERPNKRPVMSDLRDSGSIEQDADVVLMCYRDDYYNPQTHLKGYAEILIRKQRLGPLGEIPLVFQGEFSRFCDADRREFAEAAARASEAQKPRFQRRGFDE